MSDSSGCIELPVGTIFYINKVKHIVVEDNGLVCAGCEYNKDVFTCNSPLACCCRVDGREVIFKKAE